MASPTLEPAKRATECGTFVSMGPPPAQPSDQRSYDTISIGPPIW